MPAEHAAHIRQKLIGPVKKIALRRGTDRFRRSRTVDGPVKHRRIGSEGDSGRTLVPAGTRDDPCRRNNRTADERSAELIEYTARHIKEDNPTADELREWVARSGLPLKRFFNTSGLVYKNLGLKDKLPTMTEDEQIALLASDGMLVKRPLLVGDDFVLPGFKPAEWENALL